MPALMWLKAVACNCMVLELFGMIPCIFPAGDRKTPCVAYNIKSSFSSWVNWAALRGGDQHKEVTQSIALGAAVLLQSRPYLMGELDLAGVRRRQVG